MLAALFNGSTCESFRQFCKARPLCGHGTCSAFRENTVRSCAAPCGYGENGDRRCWVECTVQKVVLQRQQHQQSTSLVDWFLGHEKLLYVEIAPADAENKSKRTATGMESKVNGNSRTKTGTNRLEEVWVWGENDSSHPKVSATKQEQLVFDVLLSTELLLTVLGSEMKWHVMKTSYEMAPMETLGEARFSVSDDIVPTVGSHGMLSLPLVSNGRVCGSASLSVNLRCDGGIPDPQERLPPFALAKSCQWPERDEEVLTSNVSIANCEEEALVAGHDPLVAPTPPSIDSRTNHTYDAASTLNASSQNPYQRSTSEIPSLVRLKGHTKPIKCCAVFPSGTRVLTGSQDKTGIIWSSDGSQLTALVGHLKGITSCAVLPSEEKVVTASAEEAVCIIWSLFGDMEAVMADVRSCDVFPSADRVFATRLPEARGDVSEDAVVFSSAGEVVATFHGHTDRITAVAMFPRGRRVLTVSRDWNGIIWSSEGSKLRVLRGHTDWILSCAVFRAEDRVFTVSRDKTGIIWTSEGVEVGSPLMVLRSHVSPVCACAVVLSDKAVLTASEDRTSVLWDPGTGQAVGVRQHPGCVTSCAAFPNGKAVVTTSRDGTSVVMSCGGVNPGKVLAELDGHGGGINACAVFASGDRVLTVSDDSIGLIWPASQLFDGFVGRRVHSVEKEAQALTEEDEEEETSDKITSGSQKSEGDDEIDEEATGGTDEEQARRASEESTPATEDADEAPPDKLEVGPSTMQHTGEPPASGADKDAGLEHDGTLDPRIRHERALQKTREQQAKRNSDIEEAKRLFEEELARQNASDETGTRQGAGVEKTKQARQTAEEKAKRDVVFQVAKQKFEEEKVKWKSRAL
mmetsp:Transcript_57797/g.163065  ORF Transcript_57797/g.163065 Transcript_57797/m.163065 type:complete len:858 (+) Transcript_57797:100-2673(+)